MDAEGRQHLEWPTMLSDRVKERHNEAENSF
jgi:hypothetical protein